ncbi:MAG: hypothetical protein M0Z52_03935 [Actinomycetota bacterium]|nr:hypothetical protein [Actinomycetota bacterium]
MNITVSRTSSEKAAVKAAAEKLFGHTKFFAQLVKKLGQRNMKWEELWVVETEEAA